MYKVKEDLMVRFQRLRPIAERLGYKVIAESTGPCGSTQFGLSIQNPNAPIAPHRFDSISDVYAFLGVEEEER